MKTDQSSSVVKVDFGKEHRDVTRRLVELLEGLQGREEDIRRDPIPALLAAGEQISQLRSLIEKLREASYPRIEPMRLPPASGPAPLPRHVFIDRNDYECLLRLRELLRQT